MNLPFPMLADFSLRIACGMAVLLVMTPWRQVPLAFFRSHCQVILGMIVLATLDASRVGVAGPILIVAVVSAATAYVAAVAWGLGLPRVALPATASIALATGGDLIAVSWSSDMTLWALNAGGRLLSALLLGTTLSAMLLGHHYLTAPAMTIEPLRRFVRGMAWAIAARGAMAAIGLGVLLAGMIVAGGTTRVSPFFLGVRWGMGIFGPTLATLLTWKTVQIRSTQSATGILYIGMTLVLFGELTAMILSRDAGIVL